MIEVNYHPFILFERERQHAVSRENQGTILNMQISLNTCQF